MYKATSATGVDHRQA